MKRWLKRFAATLVLGLLLATVGIVWDWYSTRRAGQKKLDAVIAKLDAEDPGWRLHELNDARNAKLPPDDKNGAVVAAKAYKLFTETYNEWTRRPDSTSDDRPPNELPTERYLKELNTALTGCEESHRLLKTLPSLPPGGNRLVIKEPNPLETLLKETDQLRGVARFLAVHANSRLNRHDVGGAVADAKLLVAAARTISDEPFLISQLVRIAVTVIAVSTAESILGCSQPTNGLSDLQALFMEEITAPRLEWGFRGERGMFFLLTDKIGEGALDAGRAGDGPDAPVGTLFLRKYIPGQQAFMGEFFTDAIAAVRKSGPERNAAVRAVMATCPTERNLENALILLFVPAVEKVITSDSRLVAQLGCAVAGIACERHRQKFGDWPRTLADIPKDILADIPTDPFTGKPVLLKRTTTGAVVYSTGSDATDDGGETLDAKMPPGTDIRFRLYDPAHRRLPAKPKPPTDSEEPK